MLIAELCRTFLKLQSIWQVLNTKHKIFASVLQDLLKIICWVLSDVVIVVVVPSIFLVRYGCTFLTIAHYPCKKSLPQFVLLLTRYTNVCEAGHCIIILLEVSITKRLAKGSSLPSITSCIELCCCE